MPTVDEIMAYEDGSMEEEDMINFFQKLIDTGMAWTLQGHYGRVAMNLVEDGLCSLPEQENNNV